MNYNNFIEFWSQFYDPRHYVDEKYYYPYIFQDNLDVEALENLFEWKNGMPLSGLKKKILSKAINELDKINSFKNKKILSLHEVEAYLSYIRDNICAGFVWGMFLLHVTKPKEFPMIDKFTYVAFKFLNTGEIVDLTNKNQNTKEYFQFTLFFKSVHKKSKLSFREVDRALMAFGQFLLNPKKYLNT